MHQHFAISARNRVDFRNHAGSSVLERRKHKRHMIHLGGRLRTGPSDQVARQCDILDVSANGARIRTDMPLAADSWVTLSLERLGKIHAQVVWRKGNLAGVQFAADPHYVARMLLGILPFQQTAANVN